MYGLQKKAKIEEAEEKHKERLKFLEEEFTRMNKAANDEIMSLEEKKKTQQQEHQERMKHINETVAARTEPGVAGPIVQKAADAVNIDTGVELVKAHLLADTDVNCAQIPKELAEVMANSMSKLLQMQKDQMLTQMKEASMGKKGHDGKEAEEDEVLDVKVTGEDEFTVMERTGKPSGRTTRRKANGDAMTDDSTERPQQQKREAQEPADEDAQAKKQQAIEVTSAEAAATAGGVLLPFA